MNIVPTTNEGYRLMHEGVLALAEIEANGFKMDEGYLRASIKKTKQEIRSLKEEMKTDKDCKKFYHEMRKRYGSKTNLTSHDQIGQVLFGVFKHEGGVKTDKGHWVTDKEVLQDVAEPFVMKFAKLIKLQKTYGTYLRGLCNEIGTDGCIHPFYNLHLARTYRSSADHPPVQQMPVRDEEVASLVRPAFVSRWKDGQIGEWDFSGIEVRVSGCYNKDPNFLKYIRDPSTDMHRDMAMQCYMLKKDQVSKNARYCAKNRCVFPFFYGDYHINCAKALWFSIDRMGLSLPDGTSLKNHLRKKGIKELGECNPDKEAKPNTFQYHMKQVEKDFWGRRFRIYAQWRRDSYEDYIKRGYLDTLTGFRCSGIMNRKQTSNYPVQGSAFHCLLWCLIRIQKLIRKAKLKTRIIGQIHDSVLADIYPGELQAYYKIAHKTMTHDLVKHWKSWIIVPFDAEFSVSPPGGSWKDKEVYSQ